MSNFARTIREALEQSRAALPDVSFAVADGVDRDLIIRINVALDSLETSPSDLKALLVEARSILPTAWHNHGGVSDDLLKAIDSAIAS